MTDFDTFWGAYPRKQDKKKARTAFAKALKVASLKEILEGLENYKAGKEDWRAWMLPTSFLNGERWADEYETAPEVAAPFRSYDSWSDADKQECADTIARVGMDTATRSFRYSHPQIKQLREEGWLQPVRQVANG